MTDRERFLSYMQFKPVDRIPLMDMGVWPETLERWHHEGLPKWVTCLRHLEDYLRLDRSFNSNWLPINDGIYPPFGAKVIREIAAGSDPLLLRRRYPNCTLTGCMDKRAIASGREGVDAELARLAPLLEEGAFIPMLDHFVPPDVSYSTYCYYVERRRELLTRPHSGR